MQPDPRPRMGNPLAQCRDAGKPVANSQRLPVRCLQPSNGGDDRESEAHQQDQEGERAPNDQTNPSHSVLIRTLLDCSNSVVLSKRQSWSAHAFVYLQTCAVAVFVNVVVDTIPAVVFTIVSCAPFASNVEVEVDVVAPVICVCDQVRVASLYTFEIAVPGKLPVIGRPELSHAV
jgi:hypothetical protein